MDRTERLLDLVATLLDASEPVTFARIRELFPDYAEGSDEANERKFERDKAELAELGIPLRYVAADDESAAGYLIDRDAYYLPELKLRADEWAVLYAAGSASLASGVFPGARDLGHALRKIAFARGPEPVPQFSDALLINPEAGQASIGPLRDKLDMLWEAVQRKKRVEFTYKGFSQEVTKRDFDAYGIAFRRGVWITVGYCHFRKAMRTFNVSRISEMSLNTKRPKSPDFEVPADFKLADYAHEQAWEHKVHPPVDVQLQLDPSLAPLGPRLFPHAKVETLKGKGKGAPTEAEGTRLTVRATFTDNLVRQVLAIGSRVEIVGPPEVRARAKALLEDLRRDLQSEEVRS
jgi:proteasome accessory factor B